MPGGQPRRPDRDRWDSHQPDTRGPYRGRDHSGLARDRDREDRERERERDRDRRTANAENYRNNLGRGQPREYRERSRGMYICF